MYEDTICNVLIYMYNVKLYKNGLKKMKYWSSIPKNTSHLDQLLF